VIELAPMGLYFFIYVLAALVFVGAGLATSAILRNARKHKIYPGYAQPYESGEQSVGSALGSVHARFYVVALAFLLFELEITFLLPWASTTRMPEAVVPHARVVITGLLFLGLLAVGLLFIWAQGYLDWSPAKRPDRPYQSAIPQQLYENIYAKYLPVTSPKSREGAKPFLQTPAGSVPGIGVSGSGAGSD